MAIENPFERLLGGTNQDFLKLLDGLPKDPAEELERNYSVSEMRGVEDVVLFDSSGGVIVNEISQNNVGEIGEWSDFLIKSGGVGLIGVKYPRKNMFGLLFNRNTNLNLSVDDFFHEVTSELPRLGYDFDIESDEIIANSQASLRREDTDDLRKYELSRADELDAFKRDFAGSGSMQKVEFSTVRIGERKINFYLGVDKLSTFPEIDAKLRIIMPQENWNEGVVNWCLQNHRLSGDPAMQGVNSQEIVNAIAAINNTPITL